MSVIPNFDLDLGATSGGPYAGYAGAGAGGSTFTVDLRIHTCNEKLYAFELVVEFEPTVIKAVSATKGDDWPYTVTAGLNFKYLQKIGILLKIR